MYHVKRGSGAVKRWRARLVRSWWRHEQRSGDCGAPLRVSFSSLKSNVVEPAVGVDEGRYGDGAFGSGRSISAVHGADD